MASAFIDIPRAVESPLPVAAVRICVPGAPVAKGRPRLSTFGGHARAYTPAKTQRYEDLIRLEAGRVMEGRGQLQGMLRMEIRVYVQPPQAIANHKIKGPSAEAGVIRPISRPDWDNYGKIAADALNGIVYRDDAQIVSALVDKFYSVRPRLELEVVEL